MEKNMRNFARAAAIPAVLLSLGVISANAQDANQAKALTKLFTVACLDAMPDFLQTPATLEAFGFMFESTDWGLYEFWHEGNIDAYGSFIADASLVSGNRYCQLASNGITQEAVFEIISQEIIDRWGAKYDIRAGDWDEVDGWKIDIDGHAVEITISTSMSDDEAMGVSLTVSEWL